MSSTSEQLEEGKRERAQRIPSNDIKPQLRGLLSEIVNNPETSIFGKKIEQLDADEPRYEILIAGPERILKKLLDKLRS